MKKGHQQTTEIPEITELSDKDFKASANNCPSNDKHA